MEIIWLINPLSTVSKLDQKAPKIVYRARVLWREHWIYSPFLLCRPAAHTAPTVQGDLLFSEFFALVVQSLLGWQNITSWGMEVL